MDGNYIYEDDVKIYYKDASSTKPMIRVWIKPDDINRGYGCFYNGKNLEVKDGICNGELTSITVNNTKYYSAWVPWSCSGSTNCPRNKVSVSEFLDSNGKLPSSSLSN